MQSNLYYELRLRYFKRKIEYLVETFWSVFGLLALVGVVTIFSGLLHFIVK